MKVNQLNRRISLVFAGAIVLVGCSGSGGAAAGGSASAAHATNQPSAAGPVNASSGNATAGAASASIAPSTGAGGGSTGGSVTDLDHLSSLLGPGDFSAAGVAGAGTPTVNAPETGSASIVYAGKSAGTGGIELDVVVGKDATGMSDVFESMSAPFLDFEAKGKADLPMADDAKVRIDNPLDAGGTWAGIAVRKGRLVFLIGIPGSPDAEGKLVSLAKLVLDRASSLE